MKVSLLQKNGDSIIKEVQLIKKSFVVGRAQSCDWCFADIKYLSKQHCCFTKNESGVSVTCMSINGLLVNGKKIRKSESCELKSGDNVCLIKNKDPPLKLVVAVKIIDDSSDSDDTLEYKTEDESTSHLEEDEKSLISTSRKRYAQSPLKEVIDKKQVKLDEVSSAKPDEDLEENLRCIICQELFHDCVSCQPCMHSFCGGCYSMWKEKSSDCPTCRESVNAVSKNHIINNLVSSYLTKHPERQRSAKELEELDEKNTIKSSKVTVKKKEYDPSFSIETDSSTSSSDGEDNADVYNSSVEYVSSDDEPTNVPVCRECPRPGFLSTSTPATRQCPPGGPHGMCCCCRHPFPLGDLSNRKCSVCGSFFCHMYWGCQAPGCRGCLNKFRDMNFHDKVLDDIVSRNLWESRILKDYLTSHNKTTKDLFDVCINKMVDGTFAYYRDPDSIVCYRCALDSFRKLAFEYRKSIPNSDFPVAVTSRPDCYWGRECRTQTHSQHHASRYNHICNRTRFSD